jgi:hypothetical protein
LRGPFCTGERRILSRHCNNLINHNFPLKIISQFLHRYLYTPANFQAGCSIRGVARKV